MGGAADGGGSRGASTLGLVLGLGTIYTVWGSTYLAIRVGVKTIPPFLMAGSRFLIAGAVLFLWAKLRGARTPAGVHWRMATVAGGLMLLGGNGGVVWAQQFIPSSLAALLVTTMPLFMALFDWLRPGGRRPPSSIWVGLFAGFAGMAALAGWAKGIDGEAIRTLGVVSIIIASISWALGSLFAKHAPRPDSPVMTTALQMLCGGAMLTAVSGAAGEWKHFRLADVTLASFAGYLYLIIFGSLLALTVYSWLLQVTEPNLIATYAFVNPVIAVLLGWLLAGETLTGPTLIAGGIIVAAVAWLIAVQWRFTMRRVPIPRRPARVVEEVAT